MAGWIVPWVLLEERGPLLLVIVVTCPLKWIVSTSLPFEAGVRVLNIPDDTIGQNAFNGSLLVGIIPYYWQSAAYLLRHIGGAPCGIGEGSPNSLLQWLKKLSQCLAVLERLTWHKSSKLHNNLKIMYIILDHLGFSMHPRLCDSEQN